MNDYLKDSPTPDTDSAVSFVSFTYAKEDEIAYIPVVSRGFAQALERDRDALKRQQDAWLKDAARLEWAMTHLREYGVLPLDQIGREAIDDMLEKGNLNAQR